MRDPAPLPPRDASPGAEGGLARRLPLVILTAGAALGAFLLRDELSFDMLARHRDWLLAYRDANYALSVAGFVGVYVVIVAFSLPGATVASLTGGFLFGLFPGGFYNLIAASAGAITIFAAVRAGIGAAFARRMAERGGAVARLQAGLQKNEWSVLLLMRLLPVVPFFLANLLPAVFGAAPHRFAVTTVLGIIPGTFILTSVGSGLGEVFARGGTPDLSVLFSPPVIGPILGLAALTALPIAVTAWRGRRA